MQYIYGLIDPTEQKIVYIGAALRPWDAIKRHFNGAGNAAFTEYLRNLRFSFLPKKLVVAGAEVIKSYHGVKVKAPALKDDEIRLEWQVLGEDDKVTKQSVVQKYWDMGEAYFNKKPGRPSGYTQSIIDFLSAERQARRESFEQFHIASIKQATRDELQYWIECLQARLNELDNTPE